jgi:hypothetical protein
MTYKSLVVTEARLNESIYLTLWGKLLGKGGEQMVVTKRLGV